MEPDNIQTEPTTNTVPATFDAVLSTLAPDVREMIDKEMKARVHKANTEAINLRQSKKSAEETLTKLKARFEVDELSDELLDQLQRLPLEKMGADERAKQLERKLKEREVEAEKIKSEYDSMKKSVAEKSRDESILTALSKVGIKSEAMDAARKLISLESTVGDDGWQFGGKSLNDFMIDWVKSNSYLLANPVASGTAINRNVNARGSALDIEYYKNAPTEYKRAHLAEYMEAMKRGKI